MDVAGAAHVVILPLDDGREQTDVLGWGAGFCCIAAAHEETEEPGRLDPDRTVVKAGSARDSAQDQGRGRASATAEAGTEGGVQTVGGGADGGARG